MPFKSKAQQRACYAKKDKNWNCEEWSEHTNFKSLPDKKSAAINFGLLAGQAAYLNKRAGRPDLNSASPLKANNTSVHIPQQPLPRSGAIADPSKGPGMAKLAPNSPSGGLGKTTGNAFQRPDYLQMMGLPPNTSPAAVNNALDPRQAAPPAGNNANEQFNPQAASIWDYRRDMRNLRYNIGQQGRHPGAAKTLNPNVNPAGDAYRGTPTIPPGQQKGSPY